MKLYSVSSEYINYLRESFPRVYSNKDKISVHTRKYLGVVLEINTYKYYIPLSSPKPKHDYIIINDNKIVRKDSLIVMRIVSGIGENKILKGTLQIGTMIPVPETEISLYNIKQENDLKYKELITEEIAYIRKNEHRIIKNANVLYSKRKSNDKSKIVQNCLDFLALEEACDKWVSR